MSRREDLAYLRSASVAHAYPYPYGFVVGTGAQDSCCVDCFIITRRTMRTGDLVECEPVALMEQFEDGVDDHNVLACFHHIAGKAIAVERFLSSTEAERHITSCWAAASTSASCVRCSRRPE